MSLAGPGKRRQWKPIAWLSGSGRRVPLDALNLFTDSLTSACQMIPRMLRPTTHRDLRTELFGHKLESPLLIAPVGVQSIFHQDKELGVAEVATEIGVPYILSTASSSSIEDVARASGDGVRFFQLYWPQEDEITVSVSHRKLFETQILTESL